MTTDVEALIAHLEGLHVCEIDPSRETALKAADALRSQATLITRLKSMTDAQEELIREHIRAQRTAEERAEGLSAKCALLAASLGQEEKRSAELERFVGLVLKDHRNDGYPGDVDGAAVQNWALQCGLIEEFTADAPCGEGCTCAEAICADEFPTQCYRNTALGKAAIIAAQAGSKEG